jgi:ribosomal-protein-alanine N-acetyltransferase
MSNNLVGVHQVLFETDRLACRRWSPQDFDALYAVYSDVEAMRWVGDGQPITKSECEEWFLVTERNYATRGYGMFTVLGRTTAEVVGFAGLVHPGGQVDAEIKYALSRSNWGQGLATEIVHALLRYGATEHGLVRVVATVAAENEASQRVLLKCGLVLEASMQETDGSTTHVYVWKSPNAANPSIEQTTSGVLRTPTVAAHVER